MGPITQFWIKERDKTLNFFENLGQFLVAHLGQGRIHHQDEADGDGNVGGAHLKVGQNLGKPWDEVAQEPPLRPWSGKSTGSESAPQNPGAWLAIAIPTPSPLITHISVCKNILSKKIIEQYASEISYL